MGLSEALSDDGSVTGRGGPIHRGAITGVATGIGGMLHMANDRLQVEDLNSLNSTLLDGAEVPQFELVPFATGQELILGRVVLEVTRSEVRAARMMGRRGAYRGPLFSRDLQSARAYLGLAVGAAERAPSRMRRNLMSDGSRPSSAQDATRT
jgi:hypothetical protein